MRLRNPAILLAAILIGAAGYASVGADHASASTKATAPARVTAARDDSTLERAGQALPPNHPAIGSTSHAVTPTSAPPAIAWNDPSDWERIANPSAMRLATYRVHGVGASDDAELSVVRAGGTTEANIQRWLGEFDDMGKETRTETMVNGMKVTFVETSGTYLGSAMVGPGPSTRHKGWALLAAIVETPGPHYFFKMLGPKSTLASARPALEALVKGISPAAP
jgi:hypothetical protein